MSWMPAEEPVAVDEGSAELVSAVVEGRSRDLGGFSVQRVLPATAHKMVGPFIFFDHFGPTTFAPGAEGINVRPHPHINLATVTYLFEGEIVHRDSLGSYQVIAPGAVNWMTAGRGIVHSERTAPERRASGGALHGIQLWVALPRADEETEPAFHHHEAASLPRPPARGVELRLIAGSAWGMTSPVKVFSPLFYADANMSPGSSVDLPDEHQERAAYVATGRLRVGGRTFGPGQMILFAPGSRASVQSDVETRALLLGGAPLDGDRHLFWNFVSSRPERLEEAKQAWKEGRFPKVPGDDQEFIPLP
jgi:redox-sensitive bicupin YhaK (pirin superfamily)